MKDNTILYILLGCAGLFVLYMLMKPATVATTGTVTGGSTILGSAGNTATTINGQNQATTQAGITAGAGVLDNLIGGIFGGSGDSGDDSGD